MIQTNNFNPEVDTKLLCTCGHKDCDERSVSQETLNKVQLVRDDYNRPMPVTSGGRCPYHPDELAKDYPGDHQRQYGLDIRYKSILERNKLMVLAGRHGATRVAFGKTFVHMAWTPTSDTSVPTWQY
jgi:hypothetical protein